MSTGRICWGAMTSFLGRRSKRPRRHLGSSDNRPCDGSISACQGRLLAAQCVPNHADRSFEPPSRKIEFYSLRADKLGLPPLPVHKVDKDPSYPLTLSFGRTLTHFHAFYDEGRALPSLAKHKAAPQPWISRVDAQARQLSSGDGIKIYNKRGSFRARARHRRRSAGCGLDPRWMGRAQSPHIRQCRSDRRRS
jgi:anaerobic selenocysteine-containing dehydrogenase